MTLPPVLYYLADRNDLFRLATTGEVLPAHDCQPWYFTTVESALDHPEAVGLRVFPVPTVETIPGAAVGTRLEDAVDAEATIARARNCVLAGSRTVMTHDERQEFWRTSEIGKKLGVSKFMPPPERS